MQLGRSARIRKKEARIKAAAVPANASDGLISSAVSLDGQSLQLPEEYSQSNVAASALLGTAPSLDGESVLLPDDDSTLGEEGGIASYMNMLPEPSAESEHGLMDFQDDVSSINDESIAHPDPALMNQNKKYLKIAGLNNNKDEADLELPSNAGVGSHKDSNSMLTPTKISFPSSSTTEQFKEGGPQDDSVSGGCGFCCPVWIRRAPSWLKIVLGISLVLLVAAIVLVAFGFSMALQNKQSAQLSEISNGKPSTPTKTHSDDAYLTPVPTLPPTNSTAANNSSAPIPSGNASNLITFYATGGRFPVSILPNVPSLLKTLPVAEGEFMVNLGDWNNPATGCPYQNYASESQLFKNSSMPVYFVVGDNEYNDCNNDTQALQLWRQYLVGYETNFWSQPSWTIARQAVRQENFAFYSRQTIFVGINLVAGQIVSADEWVTRHDQDLNWIDTNYAQYIQDGAKALVLLCNSDPEHPQNAGFFAQLFDRVKFTYGNIHFVIVHRNNPRQTSNLVHQFNSISNLDVVTVLGSSWPPMKTVLDLSGGNVTVTADQTLWYEKLKAAGSVP